MRDFLLIIILINISALSATAAYKWQRAELEIEHISGKKHTRIQVGNMIKSYRLYAGNTETQQLLKRLGHGDVVATEIQYLHDKEIVVIKDVERVGLIDLVGFWVSEKSKDLYYFRDFTNMKLYRASNPSSAKKIQSFNYFVGPSKTAKWNLLLSSAKSAPSIATLKINKNSAELEVFDHLTGQHIEKIILRKWKK